MISTQLFDSARGAPAAHVQVELDIFITGHGWHEVGRGLTNNLGRIDSFGIPDAPGIYRMMVDMGAYLADAFFPTIAITFEIRETNDHFHLPVFISPFGYSVFRT